MRWLLQRSAEKLLGSSDYLFHHIMEDLMATGGITRHATVLLTAYWIGSGSTLTKGYHQDRAGIMVPTGVRLFAMIVHDQNQNHPPNHLPLKPRTTKSVVSCCLKILDKNIRWPVPAEIDKFLEKLWTAFDIHFFYFHMSHDVTHSFQRFTFELICTCLFDTFWCLISKSILVQ